MTKYATSNDTSLKSPQESCESPGAALLCGFTSIAEKRVRTFKPEELKSGDECTVTADGDLFCTYEARPFIGDECVFIKQTKAGLMLVALKNNMKQTFSAPMRNIRTSDGNIVMASKST